MNKQKHVCSTQDRQKFDETMILAVFSSLIELIFQPSLWEIIVHVGKHERCAQILTVIKVVLHT